MNLHICGCYSTMYSHLDNNHGHWDVIHTNIYSDVTFWHLCKWVVKFHRWASIVRIFISTQNPFLGNFCFSWSIFCFFFLVFTWLYKTRACTCKLLHGSGTRMLNTQQASDPLTPFPWMYSRCAFLQTRSTFPGKLGYIKIFNIVLQGVATKIFESRLKIKVICQSLNRWEAWYTVSWS